MYKILGGDGKEYGPISADVVRVWVAEGRANTIASPVDFLGTPWSVARRPPEMGEHNQEVVEALGYTPDDIAQLAIDGAFG